MKSAFLLLVRRFLDGLFDPGVLPGDGARLGYATTLGLVAVPGALITLTIWPKYSALLRFLRKQFVYNPDVNSMPDKYLFLVLSMTVVGMVAVLKWDSLFPDRRDFANLAPLPIGTRTILLAKAAALALFSLAYVVAVNGVSSILFPLIVTENRDTLPDVLRFIGSHVLAVAGAGLWTFTTFLAVTGTMMAVLPYAVFRRAKRYAQFFGLLALLLLFFSPGAVYPELDRMLRGEPSWAANVPSVWFLALYQNLQGKPFGSYGWLGAWAGYGLLVSVVLAAVAYTLSYRWFFLKSAESSDVASRALRFPDWAFRALDRWVTGSHFDRACFRFVLKTLGRSDRHTAMVTSLLGLGAALAAGSVNYGLEKGGLLELVLAPVMILIYSVLTGLRSSFGMPSDLRSNWVFQLCAEEEADPHGTVQRVMLLFVSPLIAATAALLLAIWGWELALLHGLFTATATLLLIEFLTIEFRVIPFTCSWASGAGNTVFAVALFAVGLIVFGYGMAGFEAFALTHRTAFVPYLLFVILALAAFRHSRNRRERLVFEDTRGQLDLLRITE